MNKNEILSRSRQENAKGDEYEKYNKYRSEYNTMFILMAIICVIDFFLYLDVFKGYLQIQDHSIPLKDLFGGIIGIFLFFESLFKFQALKKKRYLAATIFWLLGLIAIMNKLILCLI